MIRGLFVLACLSGSLLSESRETAWASDFSKGLLAYENGDYAAALREWKPLAEEGHASAQFQLGAMYEKGRGVRRNHRVAVQWYRRAAEQEHSAAQVNLGGMYRAGEGVRRDYKAAVQWYRRAAAQQDARAQYKLGEMYRRGQGVAQSFETAAEWYRRAADQGRASAQVNLGVLYAAGRGTPKDYVCAYVLGQLASLGDDEKDGENGGRLRDAVAQRMTSAQLAAAQQKLADGRTCR